TGTRGELGDRIEVAGVHVSRLQAENRAVIERRQEFGLHATLRVGWNSNHAIAAESEEREGLERTDVNFVAHDDGELGSAKETLRFDVPSCALEECVTRGGETAEVGHGGAGDESGGAAGWE